jgi:translation initiation factor 3 subunit E
LNTIQTTCPHILRYLTTAVITNKRRRNQLNDLVRVLQQETHSYKDPITEFLEDLYANFDFDAAQKKLRECENVRRFLVPAQPGHAAVVDNPPPSFALRPP